MSGADLARVARQRRMMQVAKQLGQYTLLEKLGEGGMGTVYKAQHALLRRPTAVKLLDSAKVSEAIVARFEREVQLTSQLNHHNTIAIFDFGRTPHINKRGPVPGRDHWPRAWSSALIGGGIRGGQVIGRTDAEAATVVERPVSILDFMATVCRILGIDHGKQNQAPNGRPIRIVDRGANPITQLL